MTRPILQRQLTTIVNNVHSLLNDRDDSAASHQEPIEVEEDYFVDRVAAADDGIVAASERDSDAGRFEAVAAGVATSRSPALSRRSVLAPAEPSIVPAPAPPLSRSSLNLPRKASLSELPLVVSF